MRAFAVADSATCALLADGTLWCWGSTHDSVIDQQGLRQIPLRGVKQIWGGGQRFVALTDDGSSYFWGEQYLASSGSVVSPQPFALPATNVEHVGLTDSELCTLERGGTVRCWDRTSGAAPPITLTGARSIAISTDQRCALLDNGMVSCWDREGVPRERAELHGVKQLVAAGNVHCARLKSDAVYCWSSKGEETAVAARLERARGALSATPTAICAIDTIGAASCVSLPEPSPYAAPSPEVTFEPATAFAAIGYGSQHACAIANGALWCWGGNNYSSELGTSQELPEGKKLVRVSLVDTASLRHVTSVGVSGGHSCVSVTDGTVRCWGDNEFGQLGLPAGADALGPTPVPGVHDAASVAVGPDTSCVVQRDGALHCFGKHPFDATGAAQAALGVGYGCLLRQDGQVSCWGENQVGQLGTGDTQPHSAPTSVLLDPAHPLTDVQQLRVFDKHACAITRDHRLYCWGSNAPFEQGRAYASPVVIPFATELTLPANAHGARDVSAQCVLGQDSELRCWGELSAATQSFSYEPLRVGRCNVRALVPGPGRCLADAQGVHCHDSEALALLKPNALLALRSPHLEQGAGSEHELCAIDAQGALSCTWLTLDGVRPSIGLLSATLSDANQPEPGCAVDPAPTDLPKFPPLPAASVTLRAQASPGKTEPRLSAAQTTRLLTLLNDPSNYTNRSTCHDPDYTFLFHDEQGAITARVEVGDCWTLESDPEIPARHHRGNIMGPKLGRGLHELCRELGLKVCKQ